MKGETIMAQCNSCSKIYREKNGGNTKKLCCACMARRRRVQDKVNRLQKNNNISCPICFKSYFLEDIIFRYNDQETRCLILCKDCKNKLLKDKEEEKEKEDKLQKQIVLNFCKICQRQYNYKTMKGSTKNVCATCKRLKTRMKKRKQLTAQFGGECWNCAGQFSGDLLSFVFNKGNSKCIVLCKDCKEIFKSI